MRQGSSLAVACLLLAARVVSAQELIPQPQPDPGPQVPPPPAYPPVGPYAPYPPPPAYAPAPPPFFASDPAGNPTLWLGFDGLLWWTKSQPLSVPVVTTGPAAQGASAGNLGMPGTTSLNEPLHFGPAGGFRLSAGGWFDAAHTIGLDGSAFILAQQSAGFSVVDRSQAGNLVLNEPVPGAPFSTQVSAPGIETGAVAVGATSRFGGADLNVLYNLYRGSAWTVNLLGGYRYLELDEALHIGANSNLFTTTTYSDNQGNVLATALPGSSVTVLDQFRTRNQFNGGQLGSSFQYLWQRWSISGSAKVAFGATREAITIDGATTVFPLNSAPVPLAGGNFATLQTGRYVVDRFAVAPEGQLNLGYQITPVLRGQIGYSFIYLSNVARPGNQIDNRFDGVIHPIAPLSGSWYWGQGLNVGLQLRF